MKQDLKVIIGVGLVFGVYVAGAGDVFASAYLIALSENKDPYEAARFANAVASYSVEARGLSSIPTRRQAEDRMTQGIVRRS